MERAARAYRECIPALKGAGDAGRYEPSRALVKQACTRLTKAAHLLEIAIASSEVGGGVVAGTPEEARFEDAMNGAFEAAGNAQYSLERAHERAERITKEIEG
jgi:hypothetical protein